MQPEAISYLQDIAECCTRVDVHLSGCTFEEFVANITIRAAVERELSIIGEAMGAALRRAPEIEPRITDARGIIDLRHVLVHGYRRLDVRTIWTIATTEVPTLLSEVRALLAAP